MREEWLEERYADLQDTLKSNGWKHVIRPALVERQRNIAQKLARGRRVPEAEIRELQAQHALLEMMTEEPATFFRATFDEAADRAISQD